MDYTDLALSGGGNKTFQSGVTNILPNGSLEISGTGAPVSLAYATGSTLNVSSAGTTLIYSAGNAQTTNSEWNYNFANLKINNISGLTIASGKSFSGLLTMQSGKITLGNNDLNVGSISGGSPLSYVVENGTGVLSSSVGSSSTLFPIGESSNSYTPVTITNSGIDDIYAVKCTTSTEGTVNNTGVINKQWNITENIPGGGNLLFGFQWNSNDEIVPFSRDNAVVGIRSGNSFDLITSSGYSGTDPYYISTTTPLTNNLSSGKTFGVGNPAALPIELGSLTFCIKNKKVVLDWMTITEKNSLGFEIERKQIDSEWSKVGFVKGCCLSNSPKYYTFTDKEVKCGKYYYRLKMIDVDGSYEYSKTLLIEIETPKRFYLFQNYPNPFNPSTNIKFSVPNGIHHIIIKIYDLLGNEIKTLMNNDISSGEYEIELDMKDYPAGIYFYNLSAEGFSSTRKLLLLK